MNNYSLGQSEISQLVSAHPVDLVPALFTHMGYHWSTSEMHLNHVHSYLLDAKDRYCLFEEIGSPSNYYLLKKTKIVQNRTVRFAILLKTIKEL